MTEVMVSHCHRSTLKGVPYLSGEHNDLLISPGLWNIFTAGLGNSQSSWICLKRAEWWNVPRCMTTAVCKSSAWGRVAKQMVITLWLIIKMAVCCNLCSTSPLIKPVFTSLMRPLRQPKSPATQTNPGQIPHPRYTACPRSTLILHSCKLHILSCVLCSTSPLIKHVFSLKLLIYDLPDSYSDS